MKSLEDHWYKAVSALTFGSKVATEANKRQASRTVNVFFIMSIPNRKTLK